MAEKATEFANDSRGWAERWTAEFASARKFLKPWHKQAETTFKRFLDERSSSQADGGLIGDFSTRLNLFHSNITTLQSMLYGRIPKVDVDRRYADQDDDVARVAGEILQRILNTDIEDAGEDYSYVLRSSLGDRLIGGLGTARVRYDFQQGTRRVDPISDALTGEVKAEGFEEEYIEDEWVDVDYLHWRDVLWSPARTWAELRWRAYCAYMTRDELVARFGEDIGNAVPLNSTGPDWSGKNTGKKLKEEEEMWLQARVWEIWDKQNKKIWWFVEGYDQMLEQKDPILDLDGFFPEPPPLMANLTTNKYIPTPDFVIAQDLYNEIDILETRIVLLTSACKAVGVYEKGNDGVQRLLMEGIENQLIPVDNWAAFAEKGGMDGAIDWLPIEQVAKTIDILKDQQAEKINQLYQVTGMADILRGASTMAASATEQAIKAKFASIRVQALQDEFSRWASDIMRLKAEIISKHYQPYCIIQQSNINTTPDSQYAAQAVQLIKDPKAARWKIVVKPESLAMVDYAQLKQDRTEYINALAVFMQSAAPLLELDKSATGPLLELLKWGLAGFKGSNEIEGVMDRAISDFNKKQQEQAGKPPPPDPETIKAQAQMQIAQVKAQAEVQKMQMQMQLDQQEHQFKMLEMQEKHRIEMEKIRADMIATQSKEQAQAEGAVVQDTVNAAAQIEINKSAPKKPANGAGK